jgi:glycosyltransferase involved in cell wall biosynthesis
VWFPRLIRQHRLDLTHYLHFNVPLFAPRPFVVTIHDLILSKFPTIRASTLEPAFYWFKHAAYGLVIRSAVKRATRVIAVTETTKNDVISTFHVPSSMITVTYEACDPAQKLPLVSESDARSTFGIQDPYLLYVGTAYPHKNLERLVQAVQIIRSRGSGVSLVLVGREDYFYRRLRKTIETRGLNKKDSAIVLTGYVDDDVLDSLYRSALLYVCPSLYEGFGLPGLEAMARGTPVLAAQASCLPEIYGKAAAFCDPEDVNSIAMAIDRLLMHPEERNDLRRRGYGQVQRYNWRTMAEQTLQVYNAVAREV